jgi:hypothetical protein
MTSTAHALIAELDVAISNASVARQAKILQSVTDLFLDSSMNFSDEQVAVFDDVIRRLMEKADNTALIKLSARLASIGNPPTHVIVSLAQDDDIAVSGPILQSSAALPDKTVAEIASVKGPKHLAAIAGRRRINESRRVVQDRGKPGSPAVGNRLRQADQPRQDRQDPGGGDCRPQRPAGRTAAIPEAGFGLRPRNAGLERAKGIEPSYAAWEVHSLDATSMS